VTNAACPGGAGSDFTGKLLLKTSFRVTDKLNGSPAVDGATVEDFDLGVPVTCVATASTTVGATCNLTTRLNTLIPGALLDGKRSIYALNSVEALDPGPNGTGFDAGCPMTCGDGDESTFLRPGLFVP
jgi:hypothetical protein